MKTANIAVIFVVVMICSLLPISGALSGTNTSGTDSDGHKDVEQSTETDSDVEVKSGVDDEQKNNSDTTDTNIDSDSESPVDSTDSDDNSDKEQKRKKRDKKLQEKLGMGEFETRDRRAQPISFNVSPNELGAQEFTLLGHVNTVLKGTLANEKRNRDSSKKIFDMWKRQHHEWDSMTNRIFEQSEEARKYFDSLDKNKQDSGNERELELRKQSIAHMEQIRGTYARRKVEILQQLMSTLNEINKNHKSAEGSYQKLMHGMTRSLKHLGIAAKESAKRTKPINHHEKKHNHKDKKEKGKHRR